MDWTLSKEAIETLEYAENPYAGDGGEDEDEEEEEVANLLLDDLVDAFKQCCEAGEKLFAAVSWASPWKTTDSSKVQFGREIQLTTPAERELGLKKNLAEQKEAPRPPLPEKGVLIEDPIK